MGRHLFATLTCACAVVALVPGRWPELVVGTVSHAARLPNDLAARASTSVETRKRPAVALHGGCCTNRRECAADLRGGEPARVFGPTVIGLPIQDAFRSAEKGALPTRCARNIRSGYLCDSHHGKRKRGARRGGGCRCQAKAAVARLLALVGLIVLELPAHKAVELLGDLRPVVP
jgi:hypothetical protein